MWTARRHRRAGDCVFDGWLVHFGLLSTMPATARRILASYTFYRRDCQMAGLRRTGFRLVDEGVV
jgi:hypothetical protein